VKITMSTRSTIDLRQMLDASGLTLTELEAATSIDKTTLSRIMNGLRVSDERKRVIAAAIADGIERHAKEVRKTRRIVAKMVNTETAAA
jgi:transcriptional regulator with XRE-family HTH domain